MTHVTGASGCGKSTLLYLAAGIYPHGPACAGGQGHRGGSGPRLHDAAGAVPAGGDDVSESGAAVLYGYGKK